jgi:hypothetical protein
VRASRDRELGVELQHPGGRPPHILFVQNGTAPAIERRFQFREYAFADRRRDFVDAETSAGSEAKGVVILRGILAR